MPPVSPRARLRLHYTSPTSVVCRQTLGLIRHIQSNSFRACRLASIPSNGQRALPVAHGTARGPCRYKPAIGQGSSTTGHGDNDSHGVQDLSALLSAQPVSPQRMRNHVRAESHTSPSLLEAYVPGASIHCNGQPHASGPASPFTSSFQVASCACVHVEGPHGPPHMSEAARSWLGRAKLLMCAHSACLVAYAGARGASQLDVTVCQPTAGFHRKTGQPPGVSHRAQAVMMKHNIVRRYQLDRF